ncbi:hypothetical protein EGW08_000675 [Elysia chlorotica]|uniref:Superoxide dismutase copper/zinc binding domain-containing protein n=1 Tax=Elysia chlorotica TaxID=188477 RepID=A0A3S1AGP7_ELYCH|nr:hypothetical protein EGW08_000675 [Elysia chlorotica]
MNWIYILTFVTAALAQWSQGQPMKAQFHMNGVTGQADLTESGGTLTIRLNIDNNLGMTTVEIHPIWVNYDGMDKCSPKMLGNAMSGLSKDATIQAGVPVDVTFSNMPPADFADGYSLVLRDPQSQSEICCATIQQSVDYVTAMVRFRGTVLGDVYLRQANVAGSSTRIVYDLATQTDAQAANWRITDSYTTCEEFMKNIFHAIYDTRTSESDGCSSVDARQKECAIGDLTGKLDLIGFAPNVGSSMRKAVTDYNLPLFGDNNVDNLLMLILPIGKEIMPACGKINVYAERSAKAVFSNDGVTGTIKFSQKSPLDPTVTSVNLQGLQSFAGGYHVHMWPVPERQASSQTSMCSPGHVSGHFNPFIDQVGTPGSDSYPDAGTSTYDMFEVGDLSGKYGLLNGEMSKSGTYTDYNLQLFGTNSIVGRSLVIHRNDATSSRWVCVNIEPQYPVITAEALFLHPVIGRVLFMQERGRPELDTSVFARLDYIDETPDTRNHKWMVGKMGPGSLVLDEPPSCESTVYNPESLWQNKDDSQYSMLCMGNSATCITGDLSGKLGLLDIGYQSTTEDEAKKWFATDTYLPLSSPHSIIRQPIVIRNVENSQILACATIQPVHPVALVAQLTSGTVTGTVRFSQEPGFGSKQTTVKRSLKGFTDGQR